LPLRLSSLAETRTLQNAIHCFPKNTRRSEGCCSTFFTLLVLKSLASFDARTFPPHLCQRGVIPSLKILSVALSPRAAGASGRRASSGALECSGKKEITPRETTSSAVFTLPVVAGSILDILFVLPQQNKGVLLTDLLRRGDIVLFHF